MHKEKPGTPFNSLQKAPSLPSIEQGKLVGPEVKLMSRNHHRVSKLPNRICNVLHCLHLAAGIM